MRRLEGRRSRRKEVENCFKEARDEAERNERRTTTLAPHRTPTSILYRSLAHTILFETKNRNPNFAFCPLLPAAYWAYRFGDDTGLLGQTVYRCELWTICKHTEKSNELGDSALLVPRRCKAACRSLRSQVWQEQ